MIKIFGYECRRLTGNKFFAGLVLVLLVYGWQVLERVTILGTAHTAPFSPWSFGEYVGRMLPFLWMGALFFLTFFTSAGARRTAVLTDAACVMPRRYGLARCMAALTGTGLLALISLTEALVFYGLYFCRHGFPVNVRALMLPAPVTLVPALVFALGSGWFLGRIRPWLVYVWMTVPFLCLVLPLPESLGFWDGSFFSQYPLTLGTLDPAFVLPDSIVRVQAALFAAGVLLLFLPGRRRCF